MFGIVRRKSHAMLAKQEFGQGVEHFKAAATHAARGTGASVGPKISSAKTSVGPTASKVRDVANSGWGTAVATLAPLAAAIAEGAQQTGRTADKVGKKADKASRNASKQVSKASAKNARKLDRKASKALNRKKSGGKSRLVGITAAGLAVGAAAAMVMRRRQRQQWEEYDPSQPIATGPVGTETLSSTPNPTVAPTMSPDPTAPNAADQASAKRS